MKSLKVLLVEDSMEDGLLLLRELSRGGYQPEHLRVDTPEELRGALKAKEWDLVLSDYRMPGFDASAALVILQESGKDIPFIIVSGKIGEDLAVAALKAGASDYVMKGSLARLVPVVERELREAAERRQHQSSQQQVRRAKAEWEAAFDAVSDLILVTDPEGHIARCNARVAAYFECSYADLIGRKIDEVFLGEGGDGAVRFVHGSRSELEEDITFPKLKGWFNVASYPMRMDGNERAATVFIIKDVTRRRQMEEEKRASDRELLTLYAVAFRLQVTQGMEKVMGDLLFQLHNMLQMDYSCIHLWARGGGLRLNASLGISPAFEKAIEGLPKKEQWCELARGGRPFGGDRPEKGFPAKARGPAVEMGMHCWCAIPLRIGQEVLGTMMVGTATPDRRFSDRDIFLLSSICAQLAVLIENYQLYDRMKEKAQELYRSKEELKANLHKVQRANEELGRLNTVKNNFIGIASHELKTPITSILGGTEFLLKYSDIQMSPEQRCIFESVYEGIVQLRRLVEDLLSISRIEAQGTLPQKKPVNLMRLCREVHDMFMLPLLERRITVSIQNDDTEVPLDEGFAMLAVKNLMENAIKFTPDGGKVELRGRVMKRAELNSGILSSFYPDFPHGFAKAKRFYLLQVKDTGIGIPDEERVRIFDKFYGVGDLVHHSSGDTAFMSKGSGLGLSIVRGIMDVHQGAVWVSGEGGGSEFSLLFPMDE